MQTPGRMLLRALPAVLASFGIALAAALPPSAGATNLFTLDPQAESIGPVVVDQSGNGYIAWLHKSGASDTVAFCKLPAGARKCAHSVSLASPVAEPDTPFTVLGPGEYVFLVTPSYSTNQMIMWQSSDGGTTFSAPAVITAGPGQSFGCQVETDLNDVLAFNAYGGEYARSQGTATLPGGSPDGLEFEMSSSNPFVNWTFAFYGQGCTVPLGVRSNPGAIPWQYFPFGGGEFGGQHSTLGWMSAGAGACPRSTPGDEVTAYEDDATTPPSIRFYHYSAPSGPCSTTGENLSPSASRNWHGPTTIAQGVYPRLAGGKSGLFLLSGDEPAASGEAPTALDLRAYDVASHTFGGPLKLTSISNPSGLDPDSGGLGENGESGELAAVWPDVSGASGLMSLFISTDGGSHFSAAQQIGNIGSAYAVGDNIRVAVAANGTGFVTYRDGSGLHVVDLETLASPYRRLTVHHHKILELPVTCEAPTGTCKASAKIKVHGVVIARGSTTLPAGTTGTLRLVLHRKGRQLLAHAHGHLGASLELTITHPGASSEHVSTHTELVS